MVKFVWAGLATAALGAAPAVAQTSTTGNDVRCLLISNLFAGQGADAKSREMASLSRFFYLGRIADRVPAAELKAAMIKEAEAMKPDSVGDAMKACLERVDRENKQLAAVGNQIKPPAAAAGPGTPKPAAKPAAKPVPSKADGR